MFIPDGFSQNSTQVNLGYMTGLPYINDRPPVGILLRPR